MKRAFLLLLCLLAIPAAAVNVVFDMQLCTGGSFSNRTVYISTWPKGAVQVINNQITAPDRITAHTDSSGMLTTNLVPAAYQIDLQGPYQASTFWILVPTNAPATIWAHTNLIAYTNIAPANSWAWSAAASDARYLSTNDLILIAGKQTNVTLTGGTWFNGTLWNCEGELINLFRPYTLAGDPPPDAIVFGRTNEQWALAPSYADKWPAIFDKLDQPGWMSREQLQDEVIPNMRIARDNFGVLYPDQAGTNWLGYNNWQANNVFGGSNNFVGPVTSGGTNLVLQGGQGNFSWMGNFNITSLATNAPSTPGTVSFWFNATVNGTNCWIPCYK